MRGAFIVFDPINESAPGGIEKKIMLQKQAFESVGINMRFVLFQEKKGKFWLNPEQFKDDQFLYFRREPVIEWNMVHFLKEIRRNDTSKVIFMDIPTYPYDGEFGDTFKGKATLIIDKMYRKRLNGLIDRVIITGAEVADFYGIKTINVVNGIDYSSIKYLPCKKNDELTIGCVGKLSKWHGYERLLYGLSEYYLSDDTIPIKVLIVGEGPERITYEGIVKECKLENHVEFTGFRTGEELEEIYGQLDFGCCSLGRYKSGINVIGDLKSRDFLARGIPIILGCELDILQGKEFEYAISFPNDNSNIDVKRIVDFYNKKIKTNRHGMREEIISQTRPMIDFNRTYKEVVDCAIDLLKQSTV